MKEDIAVTIVLTSSCNMSCAYCINNSGNDLKLEGMSNEWSSCEEIIECLKKIEEVRHITSVKLFGGEPMLCKDIICELIKRKQEFSSDPLLRFAITTNALQEINDETLDLFIENKMILNISIDGPEQIHNLYRVTAGGVGSFSSVINNIEKIKRKRYPFAAIAVLDERIIQERYSLRSLCTYLSNLSPIYKIEPAYVIKGSKLNNTKDIQNQLLTQEKQIIDGIFQSIKTLSTKDFIYENNIFRTINNAINGVNKQFVCSAGAHIAIFPNCSAFSCYNLIQNDFLICSDLRKTNNDELDATLKDKQKLLNIGNYPKEYQDVAMFGDYCSKENDFSSFAYKYRKTMVDTISEHIQKIKLGSPEHLALIGYIGFGHEAMYYKNIPNPNLIS